MPIVQGASEATTGVSAGDQVIGRVKITDGSTVVGVFDLGNKDGLAVAIVDGSGNQITSFGGGTQYTEGDTDASITGTAVMWEDGSDTLRAVSSAKPLPVNVVAGGAGDGSILDGVDTGIKATVFDYTSSNPLAVVLRDTNGDYVSVGGGTQYTEDAAAAANPVGTALNLIREDARAGGLTTTDGDNVAARGTNAGELYVKHVDTIAVTQSGTWDEVGINDSGNSITVDNPQLSVVGSGTEATALRVTIATDSTGVLSVDDNGSSLTVDNGGTFVVQENGTWVQVDDAGFTPAVSKIAMVGAEFDDAAPDSVDEGDGGAIRMSANRNLYVRIRDNAGNERGLNIDGNGALAATVTNATAANLNMTEASAASILTSVQLIDDMIYTDDTSTHATGTSKGALIMGAAVPTDTSVNANDIGAIGMTTDRRMYVEATIAATQTLSTVTTVGTVSALGTGTTGPMKAEDVAHGDGDMGIAVWAIRDDTLNARSGTEGDYEPFHTDANGALWVDIAASTTLTVNSHAVTNAGTFAVQVDGNALTSLQLIDDVVYAEDVGANSADKGVAILSKRVDTPNVALTNTDADWGHFTANKLGSLRTAYPEDDLATAATTHVKKYYTSTGAVTDGIVWSPAAGARWFLTALYFNVSAACTVTFEDDLAGGDSVVLKGEFAANSGVMIPFSPPMFSGEDAADLMVTTSAGNIYVTAIGYEI